MPDGIGGFTGGNFAVHLARYIGETVTIFTESGGQSGSGFTGVVLAVNEAFVRLITRVGPPPGCSLGNACTGFHPGYGVWGGAGYGSCGIAGTSAGAYGAGHPGGPIAPASLLSAQTAGGWNGYPVYTVGAVADIPIDQIVAFVHNAV